MILVCVRCLKFVKVRRLLATFRVIGRLLLFMILCSIFGDGINLQIILLGVDPRIENVMVCIPQEWHFVGIRKVHIFTCGRRPV